MPNPLPLNGANVGSVSIETLTGLFTGGYGLIYLFTHGGHSNGGVLYDPFVYITTDDPIPAEAPATDSGLAATYWAMWQKPNYAPLYQVYIKDPTTELVTSYYAITPYFLTGLPATLPNSVVIAASCESMDDNSMASAFQTKGAAAYIGYAQSISQAFAAENSEAIIQGLIQNYYTVDQAIAGVPADVSTDTYTTVANEGEQCDTVSGLVPAYEAPPDSGSWHCPGSGGKASVYPPSPNQTRYAPTITISPPIFGINYDDAQLGPVVGQTPVAVTACGNPIDVASIAVQPDSSSPWVTVSPQGTIFAANSSVISQTVAVSVGLNPVQTPYNLSGSLGFIDVTFPDSSTLLSNPQFTFTDIMTGTEGVGKVGSLSIGVNATPNPCLLQGYAAGRRIPGRDAFK